MIIQTPTVTHLHMMKAYRMSLVNYLNLSRGYDFRRNVLSPFTKED